MEVESASMSASSAIAVDGGDARLCETALIEREFHMPLDRLYALAIKFYREKDKEGDVNMTYEERLKFLAFAKQVKHGPYTEEANDAGWFDLVGNDRTRAWRELGEQSREEAMAGFVFLLDRVCPPFKQFALAHAGSSNDDSAERKLNGHGGDESELVALSPQPSIDLSRFEAQRKQIQEALNQQTYHQFRAYAQQQFAGNPQQQEALIAQLQEQHYQQYMAQVYAQQAAMQQQQQATAQSDKDNEDPKTVEVKKKDEEKARDDDSDVSDEEPGDDIPSNPAIAPASLWNRQDIVEFKKNIRKEGSEGILKVGHGETVTVRVPTHEEGSCLFWEFATDYYDIGFGVYFEWTISDTNQVSVHISESSDEEGDEEFSEGVPPPQSGGAAGDVEAPRAPKPRDPNKPHQDEIIPVYRRDCHEEVYAGSHVYPGRGVYLLKFDNSYSLWRSKTLYYRVYYSK